jgi:hypothetical protein
MALDRFGYCWRIQKVGKDTTKTRYFPLSEGNVDQLLRLGKLEHPYENRIRRQYHIKYVCLLGQRLSFYRERGRNAPFATAHTIRSRLLLLLFSSGLHGFEGFNFAHMPSKAHQQHSDPLIGGSLSPRCHDGLI